MSASGELMAEEYNEWEKRQQKSFTKFEIKKFGHTGSARHKIQTGSSLGAN